MSRGGKSRDSRYIPNVLRLVREHRSFFLGTTLAALALRLFFFVYFPTVTDDSRIYADLATNWLQHGIYGQTQTIQQETRIVPTDTRLPGYPAFLAGIFWLFGAGNFKAVLLTQILVDLATCLIVADLARRMVSDRAARIAFVLAALCPFLANYAAAALTETLEIFFTALALDCAAAALDRMHDARAGMGPAQALGRDRRGDCGLHPAASRWRHPAGGGRSLSGRRGLEESSRQEKYGEGFSRWNHRRGLCAGAARSLDDSQFSDAPSFPAAGSALRQRDG